MQLVGLTPKHTIQIFRTTVHNLRLLIENHGGHAGVRQSIMK